MVGNIELTDGKTKNTRGRRDQCVCQDQQDGLGQLGGDSPNLRAEGSSRLNESDSQKENLLSRIESLITAGDFNPGKVLEAVRLIKQAHIDYVNAHEQRLEARLDEAKQKKADFIKSCELVEQSIEGYIKENTED